MKKFLEKINPEVVAEEKYVSILHLAEMNLKQKIGAITTAAVVGGSALGLLGQAGRQAPKTADEPQPRLMIPHPGPRPAQQPVAAPAASADATDTAPKVKSPTDEDNTKPKPKTAEELAQDRKALFAKTLAYGEHRNSKAEREMRAHEHGYSPKSYIRTGGKATAWGPLQLTGTLLRDLKKNKHLVPEGLEGHLDSMIEQSDMFRSHLRGQTKDARYGPRGTGHVFPHGNDEKGEHFHKNVYMPIAHAAIDLKMNYWKKMNKGTAFDWNNKQHVEQLAELWRGHALEPEYRAKLHGEMFPGK